ncbi:hypothetical protein ACLOJK_009071 [Asimina triloba]
MASMNNWLAFSLSPQELPPQSQTHNPHNASRSALGFNSDEVSGGDVSTDCFDLASDSTAPSFNIPSLRPDGHFGILEAFNRPHQPQQDWNMKTMAMSCDASFRTSSELSALVTSTGNQALEQEQPKLEDFLGGHSFSDHGQKHPGCNGGIPPSYDVNSGDYMFSNCSLQLPPTTSTEISTSGGNNSIGLSMIKTWLRNQPIPTTAAASAEKKNEPGNDVGACMATGGGTLTNAQTLSLSMSTGSQTSSPLPLLSSGNGGESSSSENKQKTAAALDGQTGAVEAVPRKSIDTFGQRTSIYRGVTRHRWTGRYEAHLWDNSCRREGQTRKGRQGGYDKEEKAARAYDLAALKYWGTTTTTNFPISNYEKELEEMKHMTRQEYVASLRRAVASPVELPYIVESQGTQEEAAEAYDIAAIKFRGLNAVTNFDMSRYDVNSIMESTSLPVGGGKRLKESEQTEASVNGRRILQDDDNITSQMTDGISSYGSHHQPGWPTMAFQQGQHPPLSMQYPAYTQQQTRSSWFKQEPDPIVAAHGLQDLHQLHLGNTHNFFQPSALHNLMNLDSSSLEHSSGSNSVIYNGNGSGSNGFVMPPMSTMMAAADQSQQQNQTSFGDSDVKHQLGYDSMLALTDPYAGRSMYYHAQQSPSSLKDGNGYDQSSSGCNNWVQTSVQAAIGSRSNNLAVCHGTPVFSVWNDT